MTPAERINDTHIAVKRLPLWRNTSGFSEPLILRCSSSRYLPSGTSSSIQFTPSTLLYIIEQFLAFVHIHIFMMETTGRDDWKNSIIYCGVLLNKTSNGSVYKTQRRHSIFADEVVRNTRELRTVCTRLTWCKADISFLS